MGFSMLGPKADDFFVAVANFLNKSGGLDVKNLDECIRTFQAAAAILKYRIAEFDAKDLMHAFHYAHVATKDIDVVVKAAYTTLLYTQNLMIFTGVVGGLLAASMILSRMLRGPPRPSEVSGAHARAEVQDNFKFQEYFARLVYNFIVYQHDLWNEDGFLDYPFLESVSTRFSHEEEKADRDGCPAHFFLVYHPASDWHAAFNALTKKYPLSYCFRPCNDLDRLSACLHTIRHRIGYEAVIHILLPSVHMYQLPKEIIIPMEVLPIKITGQKHYSGKPYCKASILGVEAYNVTEVELLPKKNNPIVDAPKTVLKAGALLFVIYMLSFVLKGV